MTASYSGDPSVSSRDAVRFLIRDTNTADAWVQDEEIDWLLTENGNNVYTSAIRAAEAIAGSYITTSGSSGDVKSKTVGSLSISRTANSDIAKEYRTIISDLKRRMALGFGGAIQPYAGGISVADKDSNANDTDWDKPAFVRKGMDYPHSETWREELTDWPST